jgi:hypothetical protein
MDAGVLFSVAEVDGGGHCVIACIAVPFTEWIGAGADLQ